MNIMDLEFSDIVLVLLCKTDCFDLHLPANRIENIYR